ncbi:MAG: hypothetical protein AAB426_05945 [Myxococcota bacterium]
MVVHILFITALAALPSASSGPEDHSVVELLEFIGFSTPESEAAWRMNIKSVATDGAYVDRYTLASVVDIYTGAINGTYRLTPVRRTSAQGKRVDLPERLLGESNARWKSAEPIAAWHKVERRAHFQARRLKMTDGALLIAPDRGVNAEIVPQMTSVAVLVPLGSPLGYSPMARLLNGEQVELGRVRVEGRSGVTLRASVEAYYSPTGMKLAIISRVEAAGGSGSSTGGETVFWPNIVRLPSPVGTIDVAGFKAGKPATPGGSEAFKNMDPDLAKVYQRLLGGQK